MLFHPTFRFISISSIPSAGARMFACASRAIRDAHANMRYVIRRLIERPSPTIYSFSVETFLLLYRLGGRCVYIRFFVGKIESNGWRVVY